MAADPEFGTPVTGAPAAGQLLVASPVLSDPNFAGALVLLLDVDEQGSLGVVLNRPTGVRLAEVLDPWEPVASAPAVLFRGGPVEPDGAIGVARLADGVADPPGWRRMFGRTGLVDLDVPTYGDYDAVRVYAGYAGWGPGQLQAEIAEGAWYVVPALPEDLDAPDPDALWRQVLRRQTGALALLVTMPLDPTSN
jgi:putative transcriptional regulator